jgi:radical SAM superfamily enzyme YgiQ (UPF0313 family)
MMDVWYTGGHRRVRHAPAGGAGESGRPARYGRATSMLHLQTPTDVWGPAGAAAEGSRRRPTAAPAASGAGSPGGRDRRIYLVNPPYERIAPGYAFIKHLTNRSPSLGLLHLAAHVREHGFEPTILESDILDLDFDAVADRIIADAPPYVGITLFTVGVWGSARIARRVKAALPDTKVIVGGPHISSMGLETIRRFPEFDVAVQGEGEKILVALLGAYEAARDAVGLGGAGRSNGRAGPAGAPRPAGAAGEGPAAAGLAAEGSAVPSPADSQSVVERSEPTATAGDVDLSKVPGVIYRKNGKTAVNPPPTLELVLDELPFPAWDLLPKFPHAYKPAVYDYPRGPVATIAASRGCPFHCKFCDTSTFGAKVRYYSPKKVFEMMQFLQKTWGVRHVMFVDDLFLASRQRTTELCSLIIENNFKMTWTCDARVDTVKPDLLDLMKRAGCWQISFGLETGSDEMLRRMDKSARVEKSEKAVNWSAEAGIRVKGLFMLGYPGETRETIQMTKDFVRRIPMTIMNLTKFTPYPGSPVYRELYGTTIRDDHWEKMNGMNFVWSPDGISVEELDGHYQEVIRWFYQQKRVRRRYVRESLRNPGHLVRLARAGLGYVGAKVKSYAKGRAGLLVDRSETNLDGRGEPAAAATTATDGGGCGTSCGTGKAAGVVALSVARSPGRA